MREIAFTVKKDSDFYKGYFGEQAEIKKLRDLANEFFKNHGLESNKGYYRCKTLSVDITYDLSKSFNNQLKANKDKNGMYTFKQNSEIQKAWVNEVYSKIDYKAIEFTRIWYFAYVHCSCTYNLWHYKDNIYGILSSKYSNCDVSVPEFAELIKISEYYKIIEDIETSKVGNGKQEQENEQ